LKNHRTTATQMTAELNIHLKDPLSTETVWCELHKSNIHSRATIAKPLITRVRHRFPPPKSQMQLEDVQEEWYKILLQTVQNL
jgi:adenosine deaminase